LVYELNRQWDVPELRRLLSEVLPYNQFFEYYEVEHDFDTIGRRVMLLNARWIDHLQLILLAIEDITERRRAEQERELPAGELNHRVKNLFAVIRHSQPRGQHARSEGLPRDPPRPDGRACAH
jgi:two-component system CheB/CheR fusion protein